MSQNNNGLINWDVPFCDISFLNRLLSSHDNLSHITRSKDIVFEVYRKKQNESLKIFCCRQYVMSITLIYKVLDEFDHNNIIYIGGEWNGYTNDAKQYCLDSKIGLYVANEMNGALWSDEYWAYYKKDSDGDAINFSRGE
ncbi:MAG: hypothetical protein H0U73_03305 [Tatlockia sp.]|nr:hypothetical protein [Tatlockia sp.]